MSKAFRSACLFVFVSTGAVLSMPGCSQQGQGERCDSINGDADCDSGLTCVLKGKLAASPVDRCCPAENTETDSRCQRLGGAGNTGGTSGSGGGAAGSSGSSNGGSSAGSSSGGMSSLPEAGAAGASDSAPGGSSNSSAGAPAMTAGGANASAGAGGAP
jgi:hypothetical protein